MRPYPAAVQRTCNQTMSLEAPNCPNRTLHALMRKGP
jgi:hypothetical protein